MAEKIQIGGELDPRTTDKILGDASTIIDRTNYAGGKRQSEVNATVVANTRAIQNEITRATTTESGLQTNITNETTRAGRAEDILTANVNRKVDKEEGKGLSSNNYTDVEKFKLANQEVTPLTTSGTAIATVNGATIYAPTAVETTDAVLVNVVNDVNPSDGNATSEAAVVNYVKPIVKKQGMLCKSGTLIHNSSMYLFTSDDVAEGDTVYFSFTLLSDKGYIKFIYQDSSKTTIRGWTGSTTVGSTLTSEHVIKEGFIGCKCEWYDLNLHYLETRITNKRLSDRVDANVSSINGINSDIAGVLKTIPTDRLTVKWNIRYGVLKPDGSLRDQRQHGYVSDAISITSNMKYVFLKNFCIEGTEFLPSANTVCPIVFFDAADVVVGYCTFSTESNINDYAIVIPDGAYYFKVSTEKSDDYPESLNNGVYVDNKEARLMLNTNMKNLISRTMKSSDYEVSYADVLTRVSRSNYIYSLEAGFNGNETGAISVDLSTTGKTLAQLIGMYETQYSDKVIRINIDNDLNITSTINVTCSRNRYFITSDNDSKIGSLVSLGNTTINNGVATVSRGATRGDLYWIWVNGERKSIAAHYTEKDPKDMCYMNSNDRTITISSTYQDAEGQTVYRHRIYMIRGTAANELANCTVGAYLKLYCEWLCNVLRIVEVHADQGYVLADAYSNCSVSAYASTYAKIYYTVLNNSAVATAGTFWYDDDNVYYKLNGESAVQIKVPVCSTLIEFTNSKNVVINNLKFEGSIPGNLFKRVMQGELGAKGVLNFEGCSEIHITDCEFTSVADTAIGVYGNGSRFEISRNFIHDVGCGGVAMARPASETQYWMRGDVISNVLICGNHIREYGRIKCGGVGILVSFANNCSIISNHVFDGYYTGISLGWGWNNYHYNRNNTICGNVIHHIMQFVLADGAGIYTLGGFDGGLIENNTVYCVNSRVRRDAATAYYCDQATNKMLLYHNIGFASDRMYQWNTADSRTREIHVINDIAQFIGYQIIHGLAPSSSIQHSVLGCETSDSRFFQLSDYGRIAHNIYYDPVTGTCDTSIEDTANIFDWMQGTFSFNDPLGGDYGRTAQSSSDHTLMKLIGLEADYTLTYNGIDYPKYDPTLFDGYEGDTVAFKSNYQQRYQDMSYNVENRFFQQDYEE